MHAWKVNSCLCFQSVTHKEKKKAKYFASVHSNWMTIYYYNVFREVSLAQLVGGVDVQTQHLSSNPHGHE
jgi:hypothetical protein